MMAAMTNPGTETFAEPREHGSFRLDGRLISIVEDLATGAEEGDAGLKSCAMSAVAAGQTGGSAAEVNAAHHREIAIIEDEDECFNAIGDYLASGFSHEEIAKRIALGGGTTHLLALERWCEKVRLRCNVDREPGTEHAALSWTGSALHERRRRGRRAMAALRTTSEGRAHAAVLHVVYGWLDPFLHTLPAEIVAELGREFAPLARYTDTVEVRRIAMARAEALAAGAIDSPVTPPARCAGDAKSDEVLGDGVDLDNRLQAGTEVGPAAVGLRLRTGQASKGIPDLARHRERVRWADRVLSSGDALRAAIGPPRARTADESKEQYRDDVYLPHRTARQAFLTNVKLDANRMLTSASLAFKDAWQRRD